MILQESLTKEHIRSFRKKAGYKKSDPAITEKNVLEESAKTAYYIYALHSGKHESFQLYSNDIDMQDNMIENQNYNYLNKLKRPYKAAFFYWYKLLELKGLIH